MLKITPKEQAVLNVIADSQERVGVVPSTREIQRTLGYASQTSVMQIVQQLRKKGVILSPVQRARYLIMPRFHPLGAGVLAG